jgi:hypothetical protein
VNKPLDLRVIRGRVSLDSCIGCFGKNFNREYVTYVRSVINEHPILGSVELLRDYPFAVGAALIIKALEYSREHSSLPSRRDADLLTLGDFVNGLINMEIRSLRFYKEVEPILKSFGEWNAS